MTIKVQKIGNSLGVHLPKKITDLLSLTKGSIVEIEQSENGILIKPTQIESLESLLSQITPENSHTLVEHGDSVGKEII